MRTVRLMALLVYGTLQATARAQTDRTDIFTLEIPEMGVRLNAGSSVALPGGNPGHVLVRIGLQPTQATYGNIHARINTESANVVMTLTGTSTGTLCDFDLTRLQGFRLKAGRNSVEISVRDSRGRVRYASFLIELSGAASSPTRAPATVSTASGERYALLVGISRYRAAASGLKNLASADRDAAAVRDFLQSPEGGGYRADHVQLLLDEDATLLRVRDALRTVAGQAGASDMVVVYLSGYALTDADDPSLSFLLVHDTRPEELRETAIAFSEIEDFYGRALRADSTATFLDVARTVPFSRGATPKNLLVHQYLTRFASRGRRAVLAAADVGQTAWESQDGMSDGRGLFAHYLLDGLKGTADANRDGTVTFGEVGGYVREQVRKATGGQQSPVGSLGDAESIALAGLKVRGR